MCNVGLDPGVLARRLDAPATVKAVLDRYKLVQLVARGMGEMGGTSGKSRPGANLQRVRYIDLGRGEGGGGAP